MAKVYYFGYNKIQVELETRHHFRSSYGLAGLNLLLTVMFLASSSPKAIFEISVHRSVANLPSVKIGAGIQMKTTAQTY